MNKYTRKRRALQEESSMDLPMRRIVNRQRAGKHGHHHGSWVGRSLLPIFFLLLLSFLKVAPIASAQDAPPDLETYEQWLRAARVAAQRYDRVGLQEVADRLLETSAVRLPGGKAVPVDNEWLREAMDTPDPEMDDIADQLGALLDGLSQPDKLAPHDAQSRLEEMLNRPPFVAAERERNGLVAQFLDWLIRLLDSLLRPVGEVGGGSVNIGAWLLTLVGIVLIVGVLVYLLRGVRVALTGDAQASDEEHSEERLTSQAAIQQAHSFAGSGDYRTAVRYLYRASLKILDERGLLRYDPALTNYEYLDRLERNELRALLQPIIETFDRVWYGYSTLDHEGFTRYQQQVESLRKVH